VRRETSNQHQKKTAACTTGRKYHKAVLYKMGATTDRKEKGQSGYVSKKEFPKWENRREKKGKRRPGRRG